MLRSSPSTDKRNSYIPFGRLRSGSPPALPEYVSTSNTTRKPTRNFLSRKLGFPRNLKKILKTYSQLVRLTLIVFLLLSLVYWLFNTVLILFKFKIADTLTSSGLIGIGLKIRKPPLIFIQSSQSAAIVWESNKMASSSGRQLGLRYWMLGTGYKNQTVSLSSRKEAQLKSSNSKMVYVKRTRPEGDDGWRRWIHTALIEELEPGTTYEYEIILIDGHSNKQPSSQAQFKSYSKHRFTWYGIDSLNLDNGKPLSVTSPTSRNAIDIIHVIIIGDNQFGVKVFKNLVNKFIKIKSYASKLNSPFGPRQIKNHHYPIPTKPSLIFHLGDAVQSAHNLKQWQTDFWDPITHNNKAASEIPIIYTKGNHDFDYTGHYLYSGGLPKIQVGEINRTQTAKLKPNSPMEIPGIFEADKDFTTFKSHERDPRSRDSYFSYSPHPRVRVIVCDSNLEPTRMISPGSTLSEVDEHERWLLWEMARPEWKESSIRIILIHIPPFVEFWDKQMWNEGQESTWGQYVRTRFAPHFHAMSLATSMYDIPPASMVISGHSHTYARGMLDNSVASSYFSAGSSLKVAMDIKQAANLENKQNSDPIDSKMRNGLLYVISGGAGGTLDTERVEKWGFYERTVIKKFHFNHILLDMSPTLFSSDELSEDWDDINKKRIAYKDQNVKVYKLVGSQLVCNINSGDKSNQVWESGHYPAVDRLIWTTRSIEGKVLDRFVIEAASCR